MHVCTYVHANVGRYICNYVCMFVVLCTYIIGAYCKLFHFSTVSFTPETAILFPGDNVTFTCNDTNKLWLINDTATRKDDLELQQIDGISSGGPGFTMLIITQSANNTLYGCGIISGGRFVTDTGIVYVASTNVHTCSIIVMQTVLECSLCMYMYSVQYIQGDHLSTYMCIRDAAIVNMSWCVPSGVMCIYQACVYTCVITLHVRIMSLISLFADYKKNI